MAEKKYIIDNPNLMAEWDWEKNNELGLEPQKLSYGLNTKAWWICSKCGNRWQARITTRASRHSGCPYCAPNQSKVSEHNSLLACFPDLAREWNYDKNGVLTPDKIRFGSKKKVWWKCALGHEWQAVVSSRTNPSSGRGCPICYREYKTSFPEQAVFYYVKHFFDDAISGYISDGFEIDIFIPSLSFGVEYDGMAYHIGKKNEDKEERKNTYCKSKGIKLVRLKETIDNLLANSDGIIWCHYTPNNTFLNSAIKTLLSQYLSIANPDVDVIRDSIVIQEQYICSVKEKSIATLHPDIAKEWHPSKNGSLKPEFVRAASNKKYWWLCPNGHEYDMTALNRHNGFKCPYCSGRRILVGYNDLQTRYPQIAEQWDYEKNVGITPQEVTAGTTRKFWWKCKKGHSWYTSITTRVEGGGCPYCSHYQSAVCEDNCLATLNPELSKQWDGVKNGNLTPYDVRPNSEKKVWWICTKGHSWEASVKTRNKGNNCPYCSNQMVLPGYNDLATTNPELASEWDFEKNGTLLPTQVIAFGKNKVWWKCKKGHSYQATIGERKNGNGCSVCAGRQIMQGYNDLLTTHSQLCQEWDYSRNSDIATPQTITMGSHTEVWWICKSSHHYKMSVLKRTRGYNCPYCSNRKVLVGYNDLTTTNPELCQEWNYNKNTDVQPTELTKGSNQKVWWRCSKGHEWQASVSSRVRGNGCPHCYKESRRKKSE